MRYFCLIIDRPTNLYIAGFQNMLASGRLDQYQLWGQLWALCPPNRPPCPNYRPRLYCSAAQCLIRSGRVKVQVTPRVKVERSHIMVVWEKDSKFWDGVQRNCMHFFHFPFNLCFLSNILFFQVINCEDEMKFPASQK